MREKLCKSALFLSFFLAVFFQTLGVFAEKLPLKIYTSADGLASSVIQNVYKDSQGFLWFSARGGLSRFDGSEFVSYRLADQSSPLVHRFTESRDGRFYWIATDAGLYRAARRDIVDAQPTTPAGGRGVRLMNAQKVANQSFWALYETADGRLLAGTGSGLFAIENRESDQVSFRRISFSKTANSENRASVRDFAEAKDGSLWAASDAGLLRQLPDGRWLTYDVPRVVNIGNEAATVRVDAEGRLWTTFRSGVFVLMPEPFEALAPLADQTARLLPIEEREVGAYGTLRLPSAAGEMVRLKFAETETVRAGQAITAFVEDLLQTADGKVWIPTEKSLYVFEGDRYRRMQDAEFLPGKAKRVVEDREGNLWFGTFSGVIKYTRGGLSTYNQTSGLVDPNVHSIQETPAGELLVVHGTWRVSRLTAEGFETLQLNLPENARFSWTSFPIVADRTGALWALETNGLYRFAPQASSFSALASQPPQKIGRLKDENFWDGAFFRAFNDRRGNIWFAVNNIDPAKRALLKFNPQTGEWQDLSNAEGFPKERVFASFAEDLNGNLWFGFYGSSGLVKFAGGRFTEFKVSDGLPKGAVLALQVDRKGRLWIASNESGLSRVDDPAAEKLEFTHYTEKEGLASDNVRCLTEDANGAIYAGTVRGVSRIDAETNRIRQLTTADGLAADFVQAIFRDSRGAVWIGTSNGLSKFEPTQETAAAAPKIFISDLQIAGVNYALSEFGQSEVGGIEVSSAENNLQINFFGIGEAGSLRYQYKLEGASQAEWSVPGKQRAVDFANLAPGAYRFLVRAVNHAGQTSEPAMVSFTIRPPFWRTWWFLTFVFLLVGGAIVALDRYRVKRTREVQRALAESRESENRFRTLAETATDAILTIDEESNIIFVNRAIENVFGYRAEELIGQKLMMLMPESGLNRYLATNRKNINWSGVTLAGKHKAGHEIPLEVSFGEFERDGKRYFTGIARDVSERLRAEEELQKAREERFRELERVRTRIATDLHDDIGSSLTQIAVLSEVARGQANFIKAENLTAPLERIKNVSRELVAVMSDVVWAINPQKDFLHDLVQRMRRFGSDVLTNRGIKFEFHTPDVENHLQIGANDRREVFAIFKEAVNNAVKYSECTEVKADFQIEGGWLVLKIRDNGKGFDAKTVLSPYFKPEYGGNGLVNMQRRARDLGGSCQIEAETGRGTQVVLKIPLHNVSNGSKLS